MDPSPRLLKRRNHQRGAATLVEFAIVISVLLTIMFGIVDFARCMYAFHWTAEAAREASRWASVRGSASCPTWTTCPTTAAAVTTYVQSIISPGIYASSTVTGPSSNAVGKVIVTTTWPGTSGTGGTCYTSPQTAYNPGCVVKVQVQYTYGFSLPYLTVLPQINMTSTSQVVISQ